MIDLDEFVGAKVVRVEGELEPLDDSHFDRDGVQTYGVVFTFDTGAQLSIDADASYTNDGAVPYLVLRIRK